MTQLLTRARHYPPHPPLPCCSRRRASASATASLTRLNRHAIVTPAVATAVNTRMDTNPRVASVMSKRYAGLLPRHAFAGTGSAASEQGVRCAHTWWDQGVIHVIRAVFAALATAGILAGGTVAAAPPSVRCGPYSTCAEAKVDGRCDIPRGDPDYWLYGDADRDGMACEC